MDLLRAVARRSAVVEAAVVGAGSAALGGLVLYPVRPRRRSGAIARGRQRRALAVGAASTTGAADPAGPAPRSTRRGVSSASTAALGCPRAELAAAIPATSPSSAAARAGTCTATASRPRKKFAFTVGNTITNAATSRTSRRQPHRDGTKVCTCGSSGGSDRSSRSVYGLWMLGGAISAVSARGCSTATRRVGRRRRTPRVLLQPVRALGVRGRRPLAARSPDAADRRRPNPRSARQEMRSGSRLSPRSTMRPFHSSSSVASSRSGKRRTRPLIASRAFEPREVRAEARVDAAAERHVLRSRRRAAGRADRRSGPTSPGHGSRTPRHVISSDAGRRSSLPSIS